MERKVAAASRAAATSAAAATHDTRKPLTKGEHMRHAVIIDAVRTPIGRAHPEKGIYRDVRADDLSADLMKALVERVGIPASHIEDIHWGCVKQQGEQG